MKLFLTGNHPFVKMATLFFMFALCFFCSNAQDTTAKKNSGDKTGFKKTFYGQASFYSNKFNGRQTASGEIFSQKKMTCASNMLKLGTWVKVTNLRNGKWAIVKVNDRLHPSMKRIVDLTSAAAKQLGFTDAGLTRVRVEVIGKKIPSN
jgi:rare lipoprotein A